MEENSRKSYISNKNIQDALAFFVLAVVLLAYSLVNHYSTKNLKWELSPYLFPLLISVFVAALSLSLAADGIRQIKSGEEEKRKTTPQWRGVVFTITVSVIYYIMMKVITFIPATILFLVSMFYYLGERRIWLMALVSIPCALSIYVIFGVLLHVMLP